ncbi:hypothetical protein BH23GEM10_BH23GEM10_04830 [soil metagenome]
MPLQTHYSSILKDVAALDQKRPRYRASVAIRAPLCEILSALNLAGHGMPQDARPLRTFGFRLYPRRGCAIECPSAWLLPHGAIRAPQEIHSVLSPASLGPTEKIAHARLRCHLRHRHRRRARALRTLNTLSVAGADSSYYQRSSEEFQENGEPEHCCPVGFHFTHHHMTSWGVGRTRSADPAGDCGPVATAAFVQASLSESTPPGCQHPCQAVGNCRRCASSTRAQHDSSAGRMERISEGRFHPTPYNAACSA